MTSGLASASPGRAAKPNKTPHVHVRVSTISFSFVCRLADYGKTAARGALLSRHYIPAPEKIKCTSGKRDAVLGSALLLFQKRTKGSLLRRTSAALRSVSSLRFGLACNASRCLASSADRGTRRRARRRGSESAPRSRLPRNRRRDRKSVV